MNGSPHRSLLQPQHWLTQPTNKDDTWQLTTLVENPRDCYRRHRAERLPPSSHLSARPISSLSLSFFLSLTLLSLSFVSEKEKQTTQEGRAPFGLWPAPALNMLSEVLLCCFSLFHSSVTDSCHNYLSPGSTCRISDGRRGGLLHIRHGATCSQACHCTQLPIWRNNKHWIINKTKTKNPRGSCPFSVLFLPHCYPLTPRSSPQKPLLWSATRPYPGLPALKPHEGVDPGRDREAIYFGCIFSEWLMCWLENWPHASAEHSSPAFNGLSAHDLYRPYTPHLHWSAESKPPTAILIQGGFHFIFHLKW